MVNQGVVRPMTLCPVQIERVAAALTARCIILATRLLFRSAEHSLGKGAQMERLDDSSGTVRTARVLVALGGHDAPVGVSQLSRELEISKTAVHRILRSLVASGLATADPATRRYELGPAAIGLGRRAAAHSRLVNATAPYLAHLGALTGETTTLAARVGHRRVYVDQVESSRHIRIAIGIGETQSLANGASGLSILAFVSPLDIDLVLSTPLPRFTPRTVVDPAEIRARLETIRQRGWAHTSSERVPHSSSIAAPVFDAVGAPVGSVSVAYLESRFPDQEAAEVAKLVLAAAQGASDRLRDQN